MTLHVSHDIGFQVVASTHEFPEGGAAVCLDGGSHFYERNSVKTAYARGRVHIRQFAHISPNSIAW
ncbi:hypothetical protein [Paraburkholderia sp. CI3]|uniref:hypothetical protein n=1 Tax=Paraburkholderia sp. CI3 TaxID=2991060 RepID=UPI003D24E736